MLGRSKSNSLAGEQDDREMASVYFRDCVWAGGCGFVVGLIEERRRIARAHSSSAEELNVYIVDRTKK